VQVSFHGESPRERVCIDMSSANILQRTPLNGVIGMSELLKASTLNSEQTVRIIYVRIVCETNTDFVHVPLGVRRFHSCLCRHIAIHNQRSPGLLQARGWQDERHGDAAIVERDHYRGKCCQKVQDMFRPGNTPGLCEARMFWFTASSIYADLFLLPQVVRALAYTNAERGLKTVEQLELDPEMLVMGDPVRLHQILMNLLSNSYKFTPKGSVTVRAVVNQETDKWVDVTCSVIDTGIGIPDEQKKKLFLPFSQIESSSSRSYGGTGLGLSICKALIENVMQGKVWLDSTPGVGTTVSFSLRFQKVPKAQARDRQSTREPDLMAKFSSQGNNGHEPQSGTCIDLSTIPRNELRICIAEDNLINQRIAISFVQKLGFKCDAYLDGSKTIDALERASDNGRPFHLILM
jgi:hypothetical protein